MPNFDSKNAEDLVIRGILQPNLLTSEPQVPFGMEILDLDTSPSLKGLDDFTGLKQIGAKTELEIANPPSPDELGELQSYSYDLSITSAAKLKIPVLGGLGGGTSRRVVVHEFTQFKETQDADGGTIRWGYAIRFCVTVNKLDANANLSLPFLAAEAQLGRIEARWVMQVRGLKGKKIRSAILPPKSLDVETFVLARQSMKGIIEAINDPSTTIMPVFLFKLDPPSSTDKYVRTSITTYIVAALARGRTSDRVINKLGGSRMVAELTEQVYRDFEVNVLEVPSDIAKAKAEAALSNIRVRNA